MLPACIQVCPIEIPGRGRKGGDKPIDSVSELADLLVLSLPLQVITNTGRNAPLLEVALLL